MQEKDTSDKVNAIKKILSKPLLLQRERQNVNTTISKVVTYIEKDWDSDEELSPEPLLAALYSPKNIYASIINGVLSEKHSLDGQVAISNKLYSNQSVFVYDKKGTFIFTSEENTDSPPGMSEVNKLKSVSYKGKRGFLLQVPIYGKDKKTIVGYAQIFHDLEFYYALKERLIFLLIFLEVGMTVLVIAATVVVLTSILRPMRQLHETMGVITDSPSDLELRSKIESHDEIGDLAINFNRMMDKIQENNQMQMRFLSDVSHELRTPVTTMRMASDLLEMKKDGFDPSTKRTVELLAGQISRFQDMLAELLEISRYDAGYAALDLVETDLCEPIETAVDQVAGIAQAKRVPIHTYLPNVQVLTRIDSRRVIRIVRNLLANAVDFAEDRPIEVRVAANRKAVAISVRDYGVGIDEDKVAHVFDRFWRSDLSRSRVTGGTGLGLAIAMTDALLHHGTIRVRSAVGEGTWFLVLLPRDPDQGEVADAELPVNFASETPDDLRITGGFGVATSQVTHDYHEVRRDTMMGRPL